MEVVHRKTGKVYCKLAEVSLKIPWINIWIHFVRYCPTDPRYSGNTEYIRLRGNFNKSFEVRDTYVC